MSDQETLASVESKQFFSNSENILSVDLNIEGARADVARSEQEFDESYSDYVTPVITSPGSTIHVVTLEALEAFDAISAHKDSKASKKMKRTLKTADDTYEDFESASRKFIKYPDDWNLDVKSDHNFVIVAEEIDSLITEAMEHADEYPQMDEEAIELLNALQKKVFEKEYGNTSIEELQLPVRPCNLLMLNGIRSLGSLLLKTEQEIQSIPDVDTKSLRQIESALILNQMRLRKVQV